MKPTEQMCDTNRIDKYLDERLDETQLGEFESHLTTCDFCQTELQRRAAEPKVWQDAVALLSDQVGDSNATATNTASSAEKSQNVKGVLDSLAPTDDPEMLGRIGAYEVGGVVGVGGMGAVLKGFDRALRRVVAIKVMAPHLADSGSARTRFQREARAAAAITHDNVIDTYGVSEANGLPYLVMPFSRGPSLQSRIDESGPLTAVEVVRIGRQIAAGLAAAHEQGLVHRDIKPANILLAEGIERLWITDFGVARAMDDASMTQTGVIAGTPQYMSPEQARGDTVDHRSDLFSMGSVLYTACTGRPPFRSEAAYGILRRITDTEPRPIRELNPDIPDWLCQIIERLMAKDANLRFENANEVAELLEGCLAHMQQPRLVELPQSVRSTVQQAALPQPATAIKKVKQQPTKSKRILRTLLGTALLAACTFIAWQQTTPVDVSGDWSGENWKSVSLVPVRNVTGWYSGSFTDQQGRKGAIQLEWSRLQRQYNGRWKIGDTQTGDMTVRSGGDELRGAITVDKDSVLGTGTPRLRDYAWRRLSANDVAPAVSGNGKSTGVKQHFIESPVKGRIISWSDGIVENARVEKGEVICQIADDDSALNQRLESQLEGMREMLPTLEGEIRTLSSDMNAKREVFEAYNSRYATFVRLADALEVGQAAELKAVIAQVETAKAEVAESEATLKEVLSNKAEGFTSVSRKAKEKEARTKATLSAHELKVSEASVNAVRQKLAEKLSRAKLDVDQAKIELAKARVDLSQAERDIEAAARKREALQKNIVELETKLSRIKTSHVIAPYAGHVTRLMQTTFVKEGDVICVLTRDDPRTTKSAQPGAEQSMRFVPARATRSVGNGISDAYEVAISLGQRFRRIHEFESSDLVSSKGKEQLLRFSRQATRERDTSIAILEAQLEAAKKLSESQMSIIKQRDQQVKSGDGNLYSLFEPKIAAAEANGKLAELQLLLTYYRKLGKEQTSAAGDRQLAKGVLQAKLESATKRHDFLSEQANVTRKQFEMGDADIGLVTETESRLAGALAGRLTLEALLKHHSEDTDYAPLSLESAIDTNLQTPKTSQERETIIRLLKVRLAAATTSLEQSREAFKRAAVLVDQSIKPKASLDPLRAEVNEQEALVQMLEIQIDHYQTLKTTK